MIFQKHNRSGNSRSGISLMEVLISIGVIALGIFGVASLIPVAQFKVAEGTSNDRVASLGPSAAAQFRIQGMGDPNNWVVSSRAAYEYRGGPELQQARATNSYLKVQPYCIDPLGLAEGAGTVFPANMTSGNSLLSMSRIGLEGINDLPNTTAAVAMARHHFFLKDELVFDLPDDQTQQPRRQFFLDSNMRPTASMATSSLSWFATLSPTTMGLATQPNKDEYILSIVIMKDRIPVAARTEENFALVACPYAGEIVTQGGLGSDDQMKVSDLSVGDWVLLTKPVGNGFAARWTQIIGASGEEKTKERQGFTVGNDDFIPPNTSFTSGASVIFVRGMKAVYERTIRLEKLQAIRLR